MKHDEDEISLLQIVQFCGKNWRLLLSGTVAAGILGCVISIMLPNMYSARTQLMVAQPVGAKGAAMMLESDSILQQAVDKFDLVKRYKREGVRETKLELLNTYLKVNVVKDLSLEIVVLDSDPEMAAKIANFLAEVARKQIVNARITDEGRKLYVLQGRLAASKEQLQLAEKDVRGDIQSGRLRLDSIAVQMVSGFASLEGMLAAGGTSNLDSALMQIKMELAQASGESVSLSPDLFTEVRNVYYHRALSKELARQVQQADLMASQDVQVLVEATPPLEKSSPKRGIIVALSLLIGLVLSILLALLQQLRRDGRFDSSLGK
ncbi:GNVR domain-containing protein [Chromobacterium piscinae]|uniref:GNVR domain-containing protein n=1 Tax=Chromobacterium piscinae TaxID=686831 RepID=UPI00140978C3|nr:hypothetical protein [Chromobacterium vaccinii]MCD4506155.1 Wzz/FepE/Etk N-terminal domain-containing protein [Chromobacterium piscinae]MBX9345705.1 hypothetical protein [Chromobacterium vaccinii]MBX9358863.1 hypothetical protein [Chromobacterium vaccinii]MCD5326867.1 Wzz/FepE/Etk N-terminal domain-containing protein [Chromobacterium piscinae]